METALDAYSAPDLGASSGHPRLKRRPRVRNWLVLAVTVSSLTTPLIASAQDSNRDKEAPELIVATETGQVRGLRTDGVDKFLAIPYPRSAHRGTSLEAACRSEQLDRRP
jgi:hypothetical protein